MVRFLRFQLYDSPSRDTCIKPFPDIKIDELPAYGYGKSITLSDGNAYVVANISRIKREPDPKNPNVPTIVYEVYLAKEQDWSDFGLPKEFSQQWIDL